jgi:hypothetical protein
MEMVSGIEKETVRSYEGQASPHKGHANTEETRRKISQANKGKPKPPRTEEHARKIYQAPE